MWRDRRRAAETQSGSLCVFLATVRVDVFIWVSFTAETTECKPICNAQ